MRHLAASSAKRQDAASTCLRGKRFDFTSFRGVARSRHPATAYDFGRSFFGHQISKIPLFLIPRAPRWLASSSCGILPHSREERQDAAATYREIDDPDLCGSVLKLDPPYKTLPEC
jgi:hypothetical protein